MYDNLKNEELLYEKPSVNALKLEYKPYKQYVSHWMRKAAILDVEENYRVARIKIKTISLEQNKLNIKDPLLFEDRPSHAFCV